MKFRAYFILSLLVASSPLLAEDSQENVIKQKTEAYIEAYNKHDPQAVAAFWAEDGEYTNPESGETIQGRAAIKEAFASRFQIMDDAKISMQISSITFPSEDEAVVTGTFRVSRAGQQPQESAFKTYFERQNGEWVIGEIRDVDLAAVPDHYQYLKGLEWLIGEWIDQDEDVAIHASYKWDASKNFIVQQFSVTTEGKLELEGTQIIGWDPVQEKIRSWVFDTDGTFGESSWTNKEKIWVIETAQTLADGSQASSINVIKPINQDSYSWESSGREVGGQILPDVDPITITRKKG